AGLAGNLQRVLAARLPPHSQPAAIHFLDAIPQLPGFKPDIAKLERLDRYEIAMRDAQALLGETVQRAAPAPPRSLAGAAIRVAVEQAWSAVLSARAFKADLPWNRVDGDSLKAMELWFLIEEKLGRKLSLDAFDGGT